MAIHTHSAPSLTSLLGPVSRLPIGSVARQCSHRSRFLMYGRNPLTIRCQMCGQLDEASRYDAILAESCEPFKQTLRKVGGITIRYNGAGNPRAVICNLLPSKDTFIANETITPQQIARDSAGLHTFAIWVSLASGLWPYSTCHIARLIAAGRKINCNRYVGWLAGGIGAG